jgi:hypothetical protein
MKMYNFGMHFWPIVTFFKYANGGYLAWGVQFGGKKIAQILLNVNLMASNVVE